MTLYDLNKLNIFYVTGRKSFELSGAKNYIINNISNGKINAIPAYGYQGNNDDKSNTGTSVLYIVDLETGKLIKKIDTISFSY